METIDQVTLNFSEANLFYLNLSLGFIMFGVAINLRLEDFLRVIKSPKAALAGMFSQFLVLPALTYLLILVVQPRPSFALGMMLVAYLPGGKHFKLYGGHGERKYSTFSQSDGCFKYTCHFYDTHQSHTMGQFICPHSIDINGGKPGFLAAFKNNYAIAIGTDHPWDVAQKPEACMGRQAASDHALQLHFHFCDHGLSGL